MDSGRSRGDRRFGEDRRGRRDPLDRDRRTWGELSAEPAAETPDWLHTDAGTPGPSDFSVSDYRQRLLGGPGAELYGMGGGGMTGRGPDEAAFSAFAERSLDSGPPSQPVQDYLPSPLPRQADAEPESPAETSGLVRPYFRTKGRTKPTYDLAIEALVSTSERGRRLEKVRVPEHRSICGLCLDTRSVAEVAALLRLPLGVVRVLVGDVAGLGLVLVHTAGSTVGDRPSIEFMERVLSGLRRI
ncbi:uncharacterized protein DUF742 [Prauserella shujinwangii]|uniref:Uncharacterized protein DUF742 n=1 Tax=Prauserella shujinwangii TaxID=1453103 RepID=A0A2T0M133_9PSEU|nr:DUF742 domain-containing protein [Prauserella shujinwangii]PRX50267.1 uncharacterized protein DUF742 [Prauserella shujinwangii]